ncbi:pentapeptide repeat family protein [Paenibacillus pini JCM 16418]|uniref:Pentapeptide repeat family protein n=1 Tax=Paenibacillus pini JCM 16418 TaxID=1236976 RepID=W7YEH2_9BACL|nr:pentapeptide repeat family protein [Paenibacillus pini JCM 16418]
MYQYTDQEYTNVDFSLADIKDGEMKGCTFTKCNFRGASLDEAWTTGCQFIECDFGGATFNAPSIFALLLQIADLRVLTCLYLNLKNAKW